MPGSSALCIVADGNSPRQMFEVSRGHEVWVIPQELSGWLTIGAECIVACPS